MCERVALRVGLVGNDGEVVELRRRIRSLVLWYLVVQTCAPPCDLVGDALRRGGHHQRGVLARDLEPEPVALVGRRESHGRTELFVLVVTAGGLLLGADAEPCQQRPAALGQEADDAVHHGQHHGLQPGDYLGDLAGKPAQVEQTGEEVDDRRDQRSRAPSRPRWRRAVTFPAMTSAMPFTTASMKLKILAAFWKIHFRPCRSARSPGRSRRRG